VHWVWGRASRSFSVREFTIGWSNCRITVLAGLNGF